jgi:hypothetical protein
VSNVGPSSKKHNDVSVATVHSPSVNVSSNVPTSDNASRGAVVNSRRCFVCDSPNHLQNYHSRVENRGKSQTGKSEKTNKNVNVNAVCANSGTESNSNAGSLIMQRTNHKTKSDAVRAANDVIDNKDAEMKAFVCDVVVGDVGSDCLASRLRGVETIPLSMDLSEMHYLPVVLSDADGNECVLNGLDDSGAEICLLSAKSVRGLNLNQLGTVVLSGAIGGPVKSHLARVKITCADYPTDAFEVMCAVCDSATHPLILTSEVVRRLQHFRSGPIVAAVTNCEVVGDSVSDTVIDDDRKDDDVCVGSSVIDPDNLSRSNSTGCEMNADAQSLFDEQRTDESLASCFALVKRGKGRLFFKNGVLHRVDKQGRPWSS